MSFSLSKYARAFLESAPGMWSVTETEVPGLRFVIAAVISLLRQQQRGEVAAAVVDEALLHTLLSVAAPRADRVHLRAQIGDRLVPFTDAVTALSTWPKQQIGAAIDRVDTSDVGHFDVDPREAHARVVSIYTINWSNFMPYAPSVRHRFFSDPPSAQQGFLRTFLDLYDEGTDVTGLEGGAAAADWLRAHRVYRAQHTLVLRADLDHRDHDVTDIDALERELREAHAAFADVVTAAHRAIVCDFKASTDYSENIHRFRHLADDDLYTDLSYLAKQARASLTATPTTLDARLVELLTALGVPPGRRALQALATACASLLTELMPYEPSPEVASRLPPVFAARDRLRHAVQTALRLAC